MPSDNTTTARRVREEIWNRKDFALANDIISGDCATYVHDPLTPAAGQGPAGFTGLVNVYKTAFPDAQCSVEEIIADGDTVAVRWTARGTHKGDLMGIAPTGRSVDVAGIDIYRFKNGKITEARTLWDAMGFAQQLGITGTAGRNAK